MIRTLEDCRAAFRGRRPRRGFVHGASPRIGAGLRLEGRLEVGDNFTLFRNADVLGSVRIGSGVFINRDAYIRANVTIGDNCNVGPFVRLISDTHALGPSDRRAGRVRWDPIDIGSGVWIGAGVTVLGNVTVGEGSVIAAGSLVRTSVAANVLVAGVPARLVRSLP